MTIRKTQSSAFTLIELLVTIGIIIILAAVMIPAVAAITKGNSQKQAVNTITAYLSAARTRAIAEGRQVGVVFYEDPEDQTRTAMQICVEEFYRVTPGGIEFTTFSAANSRAEYLPRGVAVATLNDAANAGWAGNATASNTAKTRVILFDAQGHLVLRNGLCLQPFVAGTYPEGKVLTNAGYTYLSLRDNNVVSSASDLAVVTHWREISNPTNSARASWHFDADYAGATNEAYGYSSPGVFVFNLNDLQAQTFTNDAAGDAARLTWIQDHAELVLVNANTGAVIR